jgi:tetratricopeptide (TPR) repeat protein
MLKSNLKKNPKDESAADAKKPKTTLRQAILIILTSLVLFIALLEGGLALFGIDPVLKQEDPFVGFAGNVPLFTQSRAPNGNAIYTTADNKIAYFNRQMFVEEKAADTYRIFCMGGSTTYGRPYNDLTAFPGWLRELLPAVDARRDWEVINAGGISYASYRVARLMEELVQYQPDLFIVYTGQNEFLEERTYRELEKLPEAVRTTIGLLARTRTWAATSVLLKKVGLLPEKSQTKITTLTNEVNAILDNSTGPADYQRDDQLRENVLEHYRISLKRMTEIAREAGAKIIFVAPASNLKDCSPFKSEHTDSITAADRNQVEALLTTAQEMVVNKDWTKALVTLDQAIVIDPRYAKLHFLRGKALFALQRHDEALLAFQTARDEDVCPLRALTPMPGIVAEVANNENVPIVDFEVLVAQKLQQEKGHIIPGEELFLDHVHPTIEGHKILAVALVEKMIAQGIVLPDHWNSVTIEGVANQIYSQIDPHLQAKALINLAKVLHWAGKMEDAKRLAGKGLDMANGDPRLTAQASNVLIKIIKQEGDQKKVIQYIQQALAIDPWSPMMHYHLGVGLMKQDQRQKGAAHIMLSDAFWDNSQTNSMLGLILFNNGRFDLAYPLLRKALQQRPGDRVTQLALAQLSQQLGDQAKNLPPVKISVQRYPSGVPEKVFIRNAGSVDLPDGLYTEWYENGTPRLYYELQHGAPHGVEVLWNQDGSLQSRSTYEKGVRLGD